MTTDNQIKNIFIDLGTHRGQGLMKFIEMYKMDETWDIYTFEANPDTYKIFCNQFDFSIHPNINHFNLAVTGGLSGKLIQINQENYQQENGTGQGSSIISLDKWNTGQSFKQTKKSVMSVNLDSFINLNFHDEYEKFIVKMDVEGSEYDIFECLFREGKSIYRMTEMYVEWHSRCFIDKSIERRENGIKESLKCDYDHLTIHEWE